MRTYWIQWHLTADCDQNCRHCYVHDTRTFEREKKRQLTLDDCLKVIDNIVDFKKKLAEERGDQIVIELALTGGDPLLRSDFFDIAAYAGKMLDKLRVFGNSYHLDRETVRRLKKVGVSAYQISLDGLEKKHDAFRRKGSFKDGLRALKLLKKEGIRENVMMSVSRENYRELIPLVKFLASKEVRMFLFTRVVALGNGKKLGELTPAIYRKLLLDYFRLQLQFKREGKKIRLATEDKLMELLLWELNVAKPKPGVIGGCGIVRNQLTILADGTVLPCRKIPDFLGNATQSGIDKIFKCASAQKYLDSEAFVKCRHCPIQRSCGGCPAAAFSKRGSVFDPDPMCWRE